VSAGIKFSYFFAVSLSFAVINASVLTYTFRLKADGEEPEPVDLEVLSESETQDDEVHAERRGRRSHVDRVPNASMLEVLRLPTAWSMAFFLMFYCGAEVATGVKFERQAAVVSIAHSSHSHAGMDRHIPS